MREPIWSGAVLCGGASRRMGRDKALLLLEGRPMAQRVALALAEAGAAQVVAIGGDEPALRSLGLTVVADDDVGAGPLGATRTALRTSATDVIAVVGCDLLAPSPEALSVTVHALLDAPAAHVAVPLVAGHQQWTHAAWRTAALPVLETCWHHGIRSLRRAGPSLQVVEVHGLGAAAVADADAPGDLTDTDSAPG